MPQAWSWCSPGPHEGPADLVDTPWNGHLLSSCCWLRLPHTARVAQAAAGHLRGREQSQSRLPLRPSREQAAGEPRAWGLTGAWKTPEHSSMAVPQSGGHEPESRCHRAALSPGTSGRVHPASPASGASAGDCATKASCGLSSVSMSALFLEGHLHWTRGPPQTSCVVPGCSTSSICNGPGSKSGPIRHSRGNHTMPAATAHLALNSPGWPRGPAQETGPAPYPLVLLSEQHSEVRVPLPPEMFLLQKVRAQEQLPKFIKSISTRKLGLQRRLISNPLNLHCHVLCFRGAEPGGIPEPAIQSQSYICPALTEPLCGFPAEGTGRHTPSLVWSDSMILGGWAGANAACSNLEEALQPLSWFLYRGGKSVGRPGPAVEQVAGSQGVGGGACRSQDLRRWSTDQEPEDH